MDEYLYHVSYEYAKNDGTTGFASCLIGRKRRVISKKDVIDLYGEVKSLDDKYSGVVIISWQELMG